MTTTKLASVLLLCLATAATAAGCMVGEVGPTGGGPTGGGPTGGDPTGGDPTGGDPTGGDPTGGGDTLTATQFLTQTGHKDCDNAFTCKATFPTDAGVTFAEAFGATATACYANAAMYNNPAGVEAAIAAGKITFDGAAAATCVAALVPTACPAYWATGPTLPASCAGVMVGKVANGAACTVDPECSDAASVCDPTALTCGAPPADPAALTAGRANGLPMHLFADLKI